MNPSGTLADHLDILESAKRDGLEIDVVEYRELGGSRDWKVADRVYRLKRAGVTLKQVRIGLRDAGVMIESGALHFLKGRIEMKSEVGGVGGFARKMVSRVLTDEKAFKPVYRGTGELFLEPTFGHFAILDLDDEAVVTDRGMFYCCEVGLQVGVHRNPGAAGALGGEGRYQTSISGSGLCVVALPVPRREIQVYDLDDGVVQVDGNFAVLRRGEIDFTVKKSSSSLPSTITGGGGPPADLQGERAGLDRPHPGRVRRNPPGEPAPAERGRGRVPLPDVTPDLTASSDPG